MRSASAKSRAALAAARASIWRWISASSSVDPLRSQTGLSRAEIIERMKATFVQLHGGEAGTLTEEEYAAAEELVRTKYSTPEWLRRVP